MAMTGMFSLRASATAMVSRAESTMTIASGSFSMSRIPSRLRKSLVRSRPSAASSFLDIALNSADFSMSSRYLRRSTDLRMVARLVSVPPSQRWLT